jgi:undecaprenyl-diphosphatase
VLGAVQGPSELLPISSSAHTALVPQVCGWRYTRSDPELRKSFEVAIHAGGALGLALAWQDLIESALSSASLRGLVELCLTVVPVAIAGLALERPLENRLGSTRAIGWAELAGGLSLVASDLRKGSRHARPAYADYLLVGAAQSVALVPGISRSGAALTVLRLRGFDRKVATHLTQKACLPVVVAASTLKAHRLRAHRPPHRSVPAFGVGACLAFVSTLASAPLAKLTEKRWSYPLLCSYRVGLGLIALAHDRRSRV